MEYFIVIRGEEYQVPQNVINNHEDLFKQYEKVENNKTYFDLTRLINEKQTTKLAVLSDLFVKEAKNAIKNDISLEDNKLDEFKGQINHLDNMIEMWLKTQDTRALGYESFLSKIELALNIHDELTDKEQKKPKSM